jgi:hypothetical protein
VVPPSVTHAPPCQRVPQLRYQAHHRPIMLAARGHRGGSGRYTGTFASK